ncbi:MAG: hypothetical protein ABI667_03970 [Sphingomicrobium sp.]
MGGGALFHAVRLWWTQGRGRLTVRLFVFEFTVVISGILAAQMVANWAQERAALKDVEIADRRIEKEFSYNLGKAMIWQAALPCLRDRMGAIMNIDADGTMTSASSTRPSVEPFLMIQMNDEQAGLYRVRFGDERADRLRDMQENLENAQSNVSPIIQLWGRIILADPARSRVTQADRQAAKVAAADILANLRGIEISIGDFVRNTRAWNLRPAFIRAGRPARACGEIWEHGRIAIPLGQ